jgi:hypothetical protein
MGYFMKGHLGQAVEEQGLGDTGVIRFSGQTKKGGNGDTPPDTGLPENMSQDWQAEVQGGDSEADPGGGPSGVELF